MNAVVIALIAMMVVAGVASCALLLMANSNLKKKTTTTTVNTPTVTESDEAPDPDTTPTTDGSPISSATSGKTYKARATYYGPDKIHGEFGVPDNIFVHTPSGGYTPDQLRKIGKYYCAMTEKFLKKGFMGKIIRVKGSKKSLDLVVVDYLPDRMDGKGVEVDVYTEAAWTALGGNPDIGIQDITFSVVGQASIQPTNTAWDPRKMNG